MKQVLLALLLFVLFSLPFSFPRLLHAQNSPGATDSAQTETKEETLEGNITKIVEEKRILPAGGTQEQLYQKLEIAITRGSLSGKTIIVESGDVPAVSLPRYKAGDTVVVSYGKDFAGNDMFFITDYVRRKALFWLFLLFAFATVIIGKWRGITSLIGMGLSFFVIFRFILPSISAGQDPILVAILGALLIVPVTFYLSHGINKKTSVAIAGTLITLGITGLLANFFVSIAQLTGYASEEAAFLSAFRPGAINIRGLLLAGIIIGGLGILDDITVSQAAIVAQLKQTAHTLSFGELYKRAMDVGRDHIASLVNTLVLVYAGAALPLLLLFTDNPRPFSEVVNYEFIAEEIVRTLVASIGLILAVPITTLLAALSFRNKKELEVEQKRREK